MCVSLTCPHACLQGVTKAVLKKDAPLSWENCVLRIMTTRKNSHAK
jgi:hypothetical protein